MLVWNCQGAGSPLTIPQLKEANNLLSPKMIFFRETKNKARFMENVRRKLGFEESIVVEAMNRSGGMALMWRREVKMVQVLQSAFTLESHLNDQESQQDWWFIGLYASCDALSRKEHWKVIKERSKLWGDKWIIAGDFNDIISNDEKWGGRIRKECTRKSRKS